MTTIQLSIPGKPIAKARPRFARRGKFTTTYSAQATEEGRMLWEITRQWQSKPISERALKISIIFYMQRPKSHYGSGKNKGILKSNAQKFHIIKPDIDNLQKMVYDCLNRVVWEDDSCVCECYSRKEYSDTPRTEIIIEDIEYAIPQKSE